MINVLRNLASRQRLAVVSLAGCGVVAALLWLTPQPRHAPHGAAQAVVASIAPPDSAVELLQQLQMQRGVSSIAVGVEPAAEADRKERQPDSRARRPRQRPRPEGTGQTGATQPAADVAVQLDSRQARPLAG